MTKSSQYLNIETRDLKSLRVYSPCDNLFQSLIDIPLYKKHFFIINGAPYPSLSNIRLMDYIKYMSVPGIPRVFFLLGTPTRSFNKCSFIRGKNPLLLFDIKKYTMVGITIYIPLSLSKVI